jgi:TrpR-related protein YerC/YecD
MASVLERKFYRAMLQLQTEKEVAAFFRDLLTLSEIDELSQRLEVATLLDQGKTQRVVAKLTDASIATVTRVNQWLKRGKGGYKLVLERLYNHRHQQH